MELTDDQKWSAFTDTLKSGPRYIIAVDKFKKWCVDSDKPWEDPRNLDAYITERHEAYLQFPEKRCVENAFCGKTCWSSPGHC